jgi:hypothetical protein
LLQIGNADGSPGITRTSGTPLPSGRTLCQCP